MIRNCKRCHRTLKVQNSNLCDICQRDVDRHKENNVWKSK